MSLSFVSGEHRPLQRLSEQKLTPFLKPSLCGVPSEKKDLNLSIVWWGSMSNKMFGLRWFFLFSYFIVLSAHKAVTPSFCNNDKKEKQLKCTKCHVRCFKSIPSFSLLTSYSWKNQGFGRPQVTQDHITSYLIRIVWHKLKTHMKVKGVELRIMHLWYRHLEWNDFTQGCWVD